MTGTRERVHWQHREVDECARNRRDRNRTEDHRLATVDPRPRTSRQDARPRAARSALSPPALERRLSPDRADGPRPGRSVVIRSRTRARPQGTTPPCSAPDGRRGRPLGAPAPECRFEPVGRLRPLRRRRPLAATASPLRVVHQRNAGASPPSCFDPAYRGIGRRTPAFAPVGGVMRTNWCPKRRGWDSNPRGGVTRPHDFQSRTLSHSVTSPSALTIPASGERGRLREALQRRLHVGFGELQVFELARVVRVVGGHVEVAVAR